MPEAQISYGAQMLGLGVHMFLSACTGIAAAVAVIRAFTSGGLKTLGNFYVDITRTALYLLLPIVLVATVYFIGSGMPQNLSAYASATTLEVRARRSRSARSRSRKRSRNSAPTAAAS